MPKFVVRGADKPEEIVEFWLVSAGGDVVLRASIGDMGRNILVIRGDGLLRRSHNATGIPGLQYDDKGRIKEVE